MTACPDVPGCEHSLNRCSCVCCLLVCRGEAGSQRFKRTPRHPRLPAVRAVPNATQSRRPTQTAWRRQSTRYLRPTPQSCCCSSTQAYSSLEAPLRHSAVDAAVEATQATALRRHRSITADRLPCRSIAAATAHHSRRAASPHHRRARAYPHRSIAAHPL